MSEDNEILVELQKISRLSALNFVKGFEQPDAVKALHSAGFSPMEIAALLGAKPDTVRKTIKRAEAKVKK